MQGLIHHECCCFHLCFDDDSYSYNYFYYYYYYYYYYC